jgi:hypothetical protein
LRRVEEKVEKVYKEEQREVMQLRLHIAVVAIAIVLFGGIASADWDPNSPADMSRTIFYQLPNPTGWDVYSEWGTGPLASQGYGAANDWTATSNALITNIHFWGSWKNDVVGQTGKILLQIFSNDTTSGSFVMPDERLWSEVINVGEYTSRLYTTGEQGWYDPRGTDTWIINNHNNMYQYNIQLGSPFMQQAGQTYWLMISMDFQGCEWGWKTTNSVVGSSSVFWDSYNVWGPHCYWWRHPEIEWKWTQLKTPQGWCDPRNPVDVAFVLTIPEPATLLLLGLGAAVVLRKRKK